MIAHNATIEFPLQKVSLSKCIIKFQKVLPLIRITGSITDKNEILTCIVVIN